MSAMLVRAPRATRIASTKRNIKRAKSLASPIVAPIAQAIPISIPQGRASKKIFTFIVLGFVIVGMLILLAVHTAAAQASFQKYALQQELSQLNSQQQSLERAVSAGESTENLVKAAYRMGMVPAGSPAFLRLSDRKILGTPVAAATQGN